MNVAEILVLCYHAVSDSWPSPAAIAPERLGAQLRMLVRRGYRALTLSEALEEGGPRRPMVVTFDDAYTSILERALPVLDALGIPATVFVPTDAADSAGLMRWSELAQWVRTEHEEELRCMSWDELRRLAARGWEVGSHTCSHPRLTEIDPDSAGRELSLSRQRCEEEIQRACTSLAYPFGSYDRGIIELVAASGYGAAVTLDERVVEPLAGRGPLEVPREAIYRETGRAIFAVKTSRIVRRIRISRAYARLI